MTPRSRVLAVLLLALVPSFALAHGGEASIVLLLPTGYYLLGAGCAVATSFLLLSLMPDALAERLGAMRLPIARLPAIPKGPVSLAGFVFLAILVLAGFFGTRDPVENPLPAMIWTIWWVCFTVLQAIVGPLWPHLNPWTGVLAVIRKMSGSGAGTTARLPLAPDAGYLVAFMQFALFGWFELIDLAPSDPARLATAICLYWILNFAGAILFGEERWLGTAEPFSVFFGLIGRLSPFERQPVDGDRISLAIVWPGRTLLDHPALPLAGVLFVLLTLSTVAFDGLSRTFVWLSSIGINPLEFPGRSAVVVSGTVGMVVTFLAQAALYVVAVMLGLALTRRMDIWRQALGRLIYSIVPIALAFQAAHYLTSVLVDGQNALIAFSDPFSTGRNLIGTAHWHTTTSFLNTLDGVTLIFNSETAIITLGHVIGIVLAHLIALKLTGSARQAIVSQIPLAMLMVAYTAFGLWLLATPRI